MLLNIIYVYISVVTGLTKKRYVTDFGLCEPLKVPRSPFHSDHFGINGIEMREHEIRTNFGCSVFIRILSIGTQILQDIGILSIFCSDFVSEIT